MTAHKLLLITILYCCSQPLKAEVVTVAVAANFAAPMKVIVTEFEKLFDHQVRLSFGSSGKFYAQIKHGAPFDIFLSADQSKPKALEQDGLSAKNSRFTYAVGTLALWSLTSKTEQEVLQRLKTANFNKLALANPKLAPYGKAAIQTLDYLQLKQTTKPKWVQGENIAQTYQFISSANAELGFVALSQIMHKHHIKEGAVWLVPAESHEPIRQDAVLLQRGINNPAAKSLLAFMRSEKTQGIIEAYGYKTFPVDEPQ